MRLLERPARRRNKALGSQAEATEGRLRGGRSDELHRSAKPENKRAASIIMPSLQRASIGESAESPDPEPVGEQRAHREATISDHPDPRWGGDRWVGQVLVGSSYFSEAAIRTSRAAQAQIGISPQEFSELYRKSHGRSGESIGEARRLTAPLPGNFFRRAHCSRTAGYH